MFPCVIWLHLEEKETELQYKRIQADARDHQYVGGNNLIPRSSVTGSSLTTKELKLSVVDMCKLESHRIAVHE